MTCCNLVENELQVVYYFRAQKQSKLGMKVKDKNHVSEVLILKNSMIHLLQATKVNATERQRSTAFAFLVRKLKENKK